MSLEVVVQEGASGNLERKIVPPEEPKLKTIGFYSRELLKDLPKDLLRPVPSRALLAVMFYIITISSVLVLTNSDLNLSIFSKLGLAILIGYGFGASAFFAHEVMHGSVFRSQILQDFFGFIGFCPFLISPSFWRFWHNRLHHGHTQKIIQDPDAFPTKRIFMQSRYMQKMFKFTPGSKNPLSYLYFFFWFSFHNLANQVYLRFRNKIFADLDSTRSIIELTAEILLVSTYIYWLGTEYFVYGFVIPFCIMNYMLMSYISTNHNISPLTKTNDPLLNSLTVTNYPILEVLHLNFGYHVEHHLFPTMSPSKAKLVHNLLRQKYSDTYKVMPKWEAIKLLYATPRIYKNMTELVNPYTGESRPTI